MKTFYDYMKNHLQYHTVHKKASTYDLNSSNILLSVPNGDMYITLAHVSDYYVRIILF